MRLADTFGAFYRNWSIAQYQTIVTWLQRITPDMDNATPTAAWDPVRRQVTSFSDGTYGVGWQIGTQMGYLPAQRFAAGINLRGIAQEFLSDGSGPVYYMGPAILWQDPPELTKGDLIVGPDGMRYVVGDRLRPFQVKGTTILNRAKLERREPNDVVYTVPIQ